MNKCFISKTPASLKDWFIEPVKITTKCKFQKNKQNYPPLYKIVIILLRNQFLLRKKLCSSGLINLFYLHCRLLKNLEENTKQKNGTFYHS